MIALRQFAAVALVLGLLWASLVMLRKKGAIRLRPRKCGNETDLLRSCGRLSLSAQHSIHYVRAGTRQLVVGVHPSGMTLLCDMSAGAERHP